MPVVFQSSSDKGLQSLVGVLQRNSRRMVADGTKAVLACGSEIAVSFSLLVWAVAWLNQKNRLWRTLFLRQICSGVNQLEMKAAAESGSSWWLSSRPRHVQTCLGCGASMGRLGEVGGPVHRVQCLFVSSEPAGEHASRPARYHRCDQGKAWQAL